MAQKILKREIIFCGPDLRCEVRKISLLAWKKMETAMSSTDIRKWILPTM